MLLGGVLIGTSGWDYDDWVGPFYRGERGMFREYARIFSTAEVNSTFYTMPGKEFMRGLARAAPRGFVFSVKLNRTITHRKRLDPRLGVERDLRTFLDLVEPLRGRLAAVLVQLPPLPRGRIALEDFLTLIPKGVRFAVEFRHPTWLVEDTFRTLERYDVAYVVVDEPLLPPVLRTTAGLAYVRWHGRGSRPWYYYRYSAEELREWVPRLRKLMDGADMVVGYFNNHFRGFAPLNALQMLFLLGIATREQRAKLREIEEWFARGSARAERLDDLATRGDVEGILRLLAGDRRFERGVSIPDSEVSLSVGGGVVRGTVRGYRVEVDLGNRRIFHDCADWCKSAPLRRFCKHMVRTFLSIPRDVALAILRDLAENFEEWEFGVPAGGRPEDI